MQISHDSLNENFVPTTGLVENRIETLKALAELLLKEMELLKPITTTIKSTKVEKINLSEEVHRFEAELIRDALIRSKGHQRKAARILGTKITTLNAKIKRYGIESYSVLGKL